MRGLGYRQHDRPVAGVLGDLAPSQLASFESFSRYGQTTVSSCRMIDAEMYGHDAEREDRHPAEGAAREQVEEAEHRPRAALKKLLQRERIHARDRDEGADAIDREQSEGEEHPLRRSGIARCSESYRSSQRHHLQASPTSRSRTGRRSRTCGLDAQLLGQLAAAEDFTGFAPCGPAPCRPATRARPRRRHRTPAPGRAG